MYDKRDLRDPSSVPGGTAAGQAAGQAREPRISMAFERVAKAAHYLEDRLQLLEERLGPVLMSEPPQNQVEAKEPQEPMPPLAAVLRETSLLMDQTARRVDSILRRLEL